jgi:hypothetical protein
VSEVVFDIPRRRVTAGRWSVRPVWIRHSGPPENIDSALVAVRSGVHLLITVNNDRAGTPRVELWANEPDASDGLAVVGRGDGLLGIAHIPLCSCGDRGCGNAGLQLATDVPANDLPTLVDLLRSLPNVPGPPSHDATWHGDFSEGEPAM